MSTVQKPQRQLKDLIKDDAVTERFHKMLGNNATSFLMSVLNCVQNNDKLSEADPNSVLMAAAVAGTLSLPIDPNIGQAYIVPYNTKIKGKNGQPDKWMVKAQFQIGYKGLIQLCHRSNKFLHINVENVRKDEMTFNDRLTGAMEFDWIQDQDERNKQPIAGYVAYFSLSNGFSKTFYMTKLEVEKHAKKYSKTYGKSFSQWSGDGFEGMAKKTVLKLLLDKYAPKSVEMQKAITTDQAIVNDFEGNSLEYADNPQNDNNIIDVEEVKENEIKKRVTDYISTAKTVEALEDCYEDIPDEEVRGLYDAKLKELKKSK